ncbi:DUF2637 domain-containing protein [Streptomyces sp. 891-h]|uniref:DUF2637 domain-containing protein n=1 Tax=unclassified Streptomyces TaxID=2593676 RepID=UPI001FAAC72B|nr:DUF2637 domain-containing protein [Streptomyces sp. 891-h]UNZ18842.1 DUF2637 domain-containing protein [Streptomyces sp. 891-h]
MTETSHSYASYAPPDPDTGLTGPRQPTEPDAHSVHAYGASTVRNNTALRLGLVDPLDTGTLGLTRFSPQPERGERAGHTEPPDLDAELAHFLNTVEHQGLVDSTGDLTRAKHRKERPLERIKQKRQEEFNWRRVLSAFSVTLTAMIVMLVSFLGAKASYPALYNLAQESAPPSVAHAWPLLIYAPWVAATLSILRTRAYRRRTVHSWLVVLFFAAVASLLCVADAPATPAGIAVAGLPPITALLCFHQLVRQLDLPPVPTPASRHARPPRATNRHRSAG